jgi:hypothetical protein
VKSGLRGFAKLRRTLRRMEPGLLAETRAAIADGAERMAEDMRRGAPRSGMVTSPPSDIVTHIAVKRGRDGLTAVIGPGARYITISRNPFDTSAKWSLKKEAARYAFFKAYWHEFGTKGSAARNIPPLPARPFMLPAFDRHKDDVTKAARLGIRRALSKAAEGPPQTQDDSPV